MSRAHDEQEERRELILRHLAAEGSCTFDSIMAYVHEQHCVGDTTCADVANDLNTFILTHKVELYETGDAFDLTYAERETRNASSNLDQP